MVLDELIRNVIDERLVEVVTAQVSVAAGTDDFEHFTVVFVVGTHGHFENGNVKRTATQVKHDNLLIFRFVQTVREGSRSWLIDDSRHFQAGDLASIRGRLSLSIVEVSWDGDYRFADTVPR